MPSVNISLKRQAYDFLKSLKSDSKSFSDVILEFKERRRNIMDFFGVLKNESWGDRERRMSDFRASFNRRLR
ncbi:hypothetical protein HYY73_04980 [Candidatus Woesearchaeota archaeon]|nr:hypothetical protein [Candidatus Woesearchaeota archaeon]